jgi:hypothetical protein
MRLNAIFLSAILVALLALVAIYAVNSVGAPCRDRPIR